MKYDKKVEIIKTGKVSDGMGGWIEGGETIVKTIDSFITPLKASVALKEYGISSTTTIKLFTKDSLPIRNDGKFLDLSLKVKDDKYKIIDFADFGKIKMLYLELIKWVKQKLRVGTLGQTGLMD